MYLIRVNWYESKANLADPAFSTFITHVMVARMHGQGGQP